MDWEELNHNLFTALEIQKVMLSLVIATIIFVAAFNVIATLIMIVLEKKREIAILKAMGANDSEHARRSSWCRASSSAWSARSSGSCSAAACAVPRAYDFPLDPKVYLIDHLPVRLSAWDFVMTAAIAVVICTVATLIPSWWAARLLPADGVRYE